MELGVTENVNIPRQQLDEALRWVKQGRMQPAEAALWLLQQAASTQAPLALGQPAATQTVSELQAKLGPPPEAIQRDWDRQWEQLAADYQHQHGQALNEISTDDLLVDSDNRLSLAPHISGLHSSRPLSPSASGERIGVRGAEGSEFQALGLRTEVNQRAPKTLALTVAAEYGREGTEPKPMARKSFLSKHRWVVPAGVFSVAASVIGVTFYSLTAGDSKPPNVPRSRETTARDASAFSPTALRLETPTSKPRLPPSSADLIRGEISFIESTSSPTPSTDPVTATTQSQPQAKPSKATLGLDSFAGGNWVSATELLPTADFDTDKIEADPTGEGTVEPATQMQPNATSDAGMTVTDSDQAADAAPDSPTTLASSTNAIQLPAIPLRATAEQPPPPTAIATGRVEKLELQFPVETGLSLIGKNQSWVLQDTKDHSVIASFVATPEELQFHWHAMAATHPLSKQLASGQLYCTLSNNKTLHLFLRPEVSAAAWPIDLTNPDSRAAWPISLAPPLGPTTLELAFQVPENVIQSWVQPPDPKQFRRSQSIIEFTLDKDPTVAIRSRLEIRTGTRITLRVRHAAQLDPSFPWQMISDTRVLAASEQVTSHLGQAQAEQTNLQTAYYKASTSEKKLLGPLRDELDAIVLRLQKLSDRLTKYDQLISRLEHHTYLTMQLNVAWPEAPPQTTQTIFSLTIPDE